MRTGSFQHQIREETLNVSLLVWNRYCVRFRLPAHVTHYIQIKHDFWKTSRIPWLHGVFWNGDTLWFRFVWKDLIAFYVLILLTEWHTEASASSAEAFQHPATPLRLYQKPVLPSRGLLLNRMTFPPCHCLKHRGFSPLCGYTTHWSCGNVDCDV